MKKPFAVRGDRPRSEIRRYQAEENDSLSSFAREEVVLIGEKGKESKSSAGTKTKHD